MASEKTILCPHCGGGLVVSVRGLDVTAMKSAADKRWAGRRAKAARDETPDPPVPETPSSEPDDWV